MTALTSGKYRSIVPPFECSSSAPPRFMTLDMESANSLRARKPAALSVDERIAVKINAHDSTRYDSANLLGLNTANFGMSPTMVLLMMETLTSCKRKMVRATSVSTQHELAGVSSNSPKTNSERSASLQPLRFVSILRDTPRTARSTTARDISFLDAW